MLGEPQTDRLKHRLNRLVLVSLVLIPFGGMLLLTMTILVPSLKNPEASFYGSSKGYPANQRAAGHAIAVQTITIGTAELPQSLSAPGESVALQSIEIRPEMVGVITEVFVAEGDWVNANQPLVQLNPNSFLDNVEISKNNLANEEQILLAKISAAEHQLAKLDHEITETEQRITNAEARMVQGIDLIRERRQSAIQTAEIRFQNVTERLARIEQLVEKGAISDFELLKLKDEYAQRRDDLLRAQQGSLAENDRIYNDYNDLLDRRLQLNQAALALEQVLAQTPGELAQAKLNLKTGQAQLREAHRHLDRTTLLAPTDGLISELTIDSGEFVDPHGDGPIMILSQNVVFEAFIDQTQLNQVKTGDTATVRLTAYPGQLFMGKVTHINPTIETNIPKQEKIGAGRQYTYSIWITIDNLNMPPGLQGYVHIDKRKAALSLPENGFLHLSGGEGMVMVMANGKAEPRAVRVGPLLDNQREVISGLTSGETIILNPQALQPGDLVTEATEANN